MNPYVKVLTLSLCASSLMLSGCARNISSNSISVNHVGESSKTYRGVIASQRIVEVGPDQLEDSQTGIAAGGFGGALVGSQIGGGKGNALAIGALGIGGAIAGALIEKELKTQNGVEYVVDLDNGEIRTVVQGVEPALATGQRVLVIESNTGNKLHKGGRSRVIADTTRR